MSCQFNAFSFDVPAPASVYTLSLHDALPISGPGRDGRVHLDRVMVFARDHITVVDLYGRGCERRSEEHTSELQSRFDLVCRLLLEKKNSYARSNWDQTPGADHPYPQATTPNL